MMLGSSIVGWSILTLHPNGLYSESGMKFSCEMMLKFSTVDFFTMVLSSLPRQIYHALWFCSCIFMRFVGINVFSEWVNDLSSKLNNVENSLSDQERDLQIFQGYINGSINSFSIQGYAELNCSPLLRFVYREQ
jgi:hypothetical protein